MERRHGIDNETRGEGRQDEEERERHDVDERKYEGKKKKGEEE